jgi:hypothetical protein
VGVKESGGVVGSGLREKESDVASSKAKVCACGGPSERQRLGSATGRQQQRTDRTVLQSASGRRICGARALTNADWSAVSAVDV